MIVNSEQCVVGYNKHYIVIEATHTTHGRQTRKHKGGRRVTCVLAGLRAHYTTPAIPRGREKKKKNEGEENREQRVVLDGGGARLADAATRHHLTQHNSTTQTQKRKRGEQNKHQGTQTIQKTSTRQSTSHGHHTLPSMRDQTPIQQ